MKGKSTPVSRADHLRQQRSQTSQKREAAVGQAVKKATITVNRPPVVVRGTTGNPVIRRAYNRPRRQFAFTMGTTGVEMLTPSIPVFKPGWRLLSAVTTVLFACLLILLTNLSDFHVQQPVMIGFERVSATDLEAALLLNGEPIYALNPREITSQIQSAFPELTNIEVHVNFPANVIISVTERVPVIAWEYAESTLWVDAEGYLFPPRGDIIVPLTIVAEDAPPLLQLPIPETSFANKEEIITEPNRVKTEVLLAAQKLSEHLGTGAVIVYSGTQGLGWSDPRGWKVYIGSTLNNLDVKVKVYRTLVDRLIAEGTQPSLINLEFLDAPYYRLEQ